MKTSVNYRILLVILLVVIFAVNLPGQKNSYVSLSNTKDINASNDIYISALDAGVVFGIGKYFYAGGGISIAKVWEQSYSSLGTGIGPDVRIHFNTPTKIKFFLEGKGRVMYLFPEYPEYAINYAFWGGPSAEVSLSERHKLKLGFCYNHLSNGKPVEQINNSSLDGLGFTIGWTFY